MSAAPASRPRYHVANLPADLRALDRWIVFAVEPGRNGRTSKIPYIPGTSTKARSNDSATWRDFDAALADAEARGRYLGFAFTPDLGLTFLDFDGVLGAHGAVKQYAASVIDALASYSEASVSGQGVHVIVRGRPPANHSRAHIGGKVEVYPGAGGRFALLTGNTRPGLGSLDGLIEERTAMLARLFPAQEMPSTPPAAQNGACTAHLHEHDLETIVGALRPSWTLGQKHDMGLAVGGVLARNGVPLEQALTIGQRLSVDDARPDDRAKAIRDSYARATDGRDIRGFQALREMIPPEALAVIDGTLQPYWQAQQPIPLSPSRHRKLKPAMAQEAMEAVQIDRFPEPPPEVYHGWFGGYLELVSATTEAPDQFHLASALTIVGAYAGRNLYTKLASGRVYPNLYTVLVGLSSESKKDTAINRAWEMAIDPPWARSRTALPYVERNGVASAESFVKGLSQSSNVIIRMSEFSEVLANARRKGTTTILTMLMKAWDTPNQLSNDSITNPATALNPYVSILAGTQPDVLAGDMIGTDITSGFANRILFVPGSGKGRNPRPPEVDEQKVHAHWQILRGHLQKYGIDEHIPIHWSEEAIALWDAFYLLPRGESAMERTMSQRHQNMVLKIALIYALSDCSRSIEYVHLQRAIIFIDWMWSVVRELMGGWATSNDNRLEQRIMTVLTRTGPIKPRLLWPKIKDPKWTYNDFSRLVDNMKRQRTLAMNDSDEIGINDD